MPPFAAFIMKVLSLSLSLPAALAGAASFLGGRFESLFELWAPFNGGILIASADRAKQSALSATAGTMTNFFFIDWFGCASVMPTFRHLKIRIFTSAWT